MQKKQVWNKLIRKDLDKIPEETLVANPSMKFVMDEFMLLSAQSVLSPERYGDDVTHGLAWPIDLRDEGIELSLPAYRTILFNIKSNTWRVKSESDQVEDFEYELQGQLIGLLPFTQIIEIEEEGDNYYGCPILHCESDALIDAFSKVTTNYYPLGIIFDESKSLTDREIFLIRAHIEQNLKPLKDGKS